MHGGPDPYHRALSFLRGAPVSYRQPRQRHWMRLEFDKSYSVCGIPGCNRVIRAYWHKPLLHNGRKPRK
jgi:hypothetical protein